MITVTCCNCGRELFRYQKVGKGRLQTAGNNISAGMTASMTATATSAHAAPSSDAMRAEKSIWSAATQRQRGRRCGDPVLFALYTGDTAIKKRDMETARVDNDFIAG